MMEGVGQRGDALRLQKEGFGAFLAKPVKQMLLYDCIHSIQEGKTDQSIPEIPVEDSNLDNSLPPLSILLVEDNKMNQKVYEKTLIKMSHSVTIANNGKEALEILQDKKFDIILMDVQMPVMNGIEATVEIRKAEKKMGANEYTPIMALTLNIMKGDRERYLNAGMDGYITKPITGNAFIEVVKRCKNFE